MNARRGSCRIAAPSRGARAANRSSRRIFVAERLSGNEFGDIAGAEPVGGLEDRDAPEAPERPRVTAAIIRRASSSAVIAARYARERIVRVVARALANCRIRCRRSPRDVAASNECGLVRAAGQALQIVDCARAADVTRERAACSARRNRHCSCNVSQPRAPLLLADFRLLKKPNMICATRRIWISSEPSVMR